MARDWLANTTNVDIELTTHCDIKCLSCARTSPPMYNHHNNLWQKIITQDLYQLSKVDNITFTSKWGDPLVHPEFLNILELLYEHFPKCTVKIETSLQHNDEEYYKELAKKLNQFKDAKIISAVYGAEENYKKFRRNGDFNKFIKNTIVLAKKKIYILWRFVVFNYNKDDIDKILSHAVQCRVSQLEFAEFWNDDVWSLYEKVYLSNRELEKKSFDYPKNVTFVTEDWGNIPFKEPDYNNDFEDNCQSLYNRSIWIDAWGGVWPCYALGKYSMEKTDPLGTVIDKTIYTYGKFNNLNNKSLKEILSHEWYTSVLPNAQENNPWKACKEECNLCGT